MGQKKLLMWSRVVSNPLTAGINMLQYILLWFQTIEPFSWWARHNSDLRSTSWWLPPLTTRKSKSSPAILWFARLHIFYLCDFLIVNWQSLSLQVDQVHRSSHWVKQNEGNLQTATATTRGLFCRGNILRETTPSAPSWGGWRNVRRSQGEQRRVSSVKIYEYSDLWTLIAIEWHLFI